MVYQSVFPCGIHSRIIGTSLVGYGRVSTLDQKPELQRDALTARGLLRMSMPTSFDVQDVIPRLVSFVERHPSLRSELQLSDQKHDTIRLRTRTDSVV